MEMQKVSSWGSGKGHCLVLLWGQHLVLTKGCRMVLHWALQLGHCLGSVMAQHWEVR